MAISPLWPKPPRWPIQPGAVDPAQRWVWHTRPRFIVPLWERASAGAAQRYVRLAHTRRTARTWQLNTGAAATLIPYAIQNWRGLVPEERWWLYTMTAAQTAHHTKAQCRLAKGGTLCAHREPVVTAPAATHRRRVPATGETATAGAGAAGRPV